MAQRIGDGGDQGLRIGVRRPFEDLAPVAILDNAPRYITATLSLMCSTTPRSWLIMM
jgi:hypothetical protein